MYVRTFYVVTVKQYNCTYVHSTWIQYHIYALIIYGEAVQRHVRCLYVDEVHNKNRRTVVKLGSPKVKRTVLWPSVIPGITSNFAGLSSQHPSRSRCKLERGVTDSEFGSRLSDFSNLFGSTNASFRIAEYC
jgi:hypothetical protein